MPGSCKRFRNGENSKPTMWSTGSRKYTLTLEVACIWFLVFSPVWRCVRKNIFALRVSPWNLSMAIRGSSCKHPELMLCWPHWSRLLISKDVRSTSAGILAAFSAKDLASSLSVSSDSSSLDRVIITASLAIQQGSRAPCYHRCPSVLRICHQHKSNNKELFAVHKKVVSMATLPIKWQIQRRENLPTIQTKLLPNLQNSDGLVVREFWKFGRQILWNYSRPWCRIFDQRKKRLVSKWSEILAAYMRKASMNMCSAHFIAWVGEEHDSILKLSTLWLTDWSIVLRMCWVSSVNDSNWWLFWSISQSFEDNQHEDRQSSIFNPSFELIKSAEIFAILRKLLVVLKSSQFAGSVKQSSFGHSAGERIQRHLCSIYLVFGVGIISKLSSDSYVVKVNIDVNLQHI